MVDEHARKCIEVQLFVNCFELDDVAGAMEAFLYDRDNEESC